MIYSNTCSVNTIQDNCLFLGRSNTFLFFFPHPPVRLPTSLLSTPGDTCGDGAAPGAALHTGAVPGALCASLPAGPSTAAEKARALEKRDVALGDKLPVERDTVFGRSILSSAILCGRSGRGRRATVPSRGWHPLPACPLSAFPRGAFVLLKLLFKTLFCWFIPAGSSPLETPVHLFARERFGDDGSARPEWGPAVMRHRGERIREKWILETSGKVTQHVVFRIESSSCLSVVLSHLITVLWGWMPDRKSTGSLPAVPAALLPRHRHPPPPELLAACPLSSVEQGDREPGEGAKKSAPVFLLVPWEAGPATGAACTGLGVSRCRQG